MKSEEKKGIDRRTFLKGGGAVGLSVLGLGISGCASAAKQLALPAAAEAGTLDVVVVGGGLGGLSCAAHLADAGMRVLLLEQHHKVGGCATSFSRKDFNFEVSLHAMDAYGDDKGPDARKLMKIGVWDKVKFIRIDELYRLVTPEMDISVPADFEKAKEAMVRHFPGEKATIEKVFTFQEGMARDVAFMDEYERMGGIEKFVTGLRLPSRAPHFFPYRNATLQQILDDLIQDPKLKAAYAALSGYYGPDPDELWGPLYFVGNQSYMTSGSWHVEGGSQALSNAYAQVIREKGGKVQTGERVEKFIVEDGRVVAVRTDARQEYRCRYVVSNASSHQTFFQLVGEQYLPAGFSQKLRAMKPSLTFVGVYLGLDVLAASLGLNNYEVLYSPPDAGELRDEIRSGLITDAGVGITAYEHLKDPWYAPPGKSVMTLLASSRYDAWPKRRKAYQEVKERIGRKLIRTAEKLVPDLSKHVEVMEVFTPLTMDAFTMAYKGTPYGWMAIPSQVGEHGPARTTPIDNLYLSGCWVDGSGMSSAQQSGYTTANMILRCEGVRVG